METYDFKYHRIRGGEPVTVTIDQDDEDLNVTLDGVYLGSMSPDENSDNGYSTDDEALKPELEGIANALNENEAMGNLPVALKEMYTDNLIAYTWSDEDLKLISHPDTDLVEFASVIRDQIYDVVLFEKPLFIYLSKEGSAQVEEIHINS